MTDAQIFEAKLQQMIADAVAKALGAQGVVNAQATKKITKAKRATAKAAPKGRSLYDGQIPPLTKRHQAIIAGFKARGIKDPQLFTDIKPFQGWADAGRVVRKGQTSVMGLFHVSQTDAIA